ncbi:hypothetical protein [Aquibacillus salsiterrae]|uniref:Uncharacterized protein n=1 Tax=Aquibacillus salsiterrae TaxID=2950439 RepID=A0A9X3WJ99_9BACI|nr:hypothetical protein [Aquibacillus salsiterrae]MDC3418384.1 hypothetical protein [Aquibacillus salsiterrae]
MKKTILGIAIMLISLNLIECSKKDDLPYAYQVNNIKSSMLAQMILQITNTTEKII